MSIPQLTVFLQEDIKGNNPVEERSVMTGKHGKEKTGVQDGAETKRDGWQPRCGLPFFFPCDNAAGWKHPVNGKTDSFR